MVDHITVLLQLVHDEISLQRIVVRVRHDDLITCLTLPLDIVRKLGQLDVDGGDCLDEKDLVGLGVLSHTLPS